MSKSAGGKTVFKGRSTPISRDMAPRMRASIEDQSDNDEFDEGDDSGKESDFDQVASDIVAATKKGMMKSEIDSSSQDDVSDDDDDASATATHSKKKKHCLTNNFPRIPCPSPQEDLAKAQVPSTARATAKTKKIQPKTIALQSPRRSARSAVVARRASIEDCGTSKVVKPKKGRRGRPPRKASQPNAEQEWEVEKVVDSQIDAVTREHFYYIKWKGFPSKDNTWEPKKNLKNCNGAIRGFEESAERRRRGRG